MNRIRTRSGEIAFTTRGEGPDMLYLHDATGPVATDPCVELLSSTFRVHAPHWPGFGDSDDAPELRDMLDFTLHGLDLIEELGLSDPVVVGHGMGGMIAAEMAAVARGVIDRLVLIAPFGLWLGEHPIPDLFTKMPYELPELLFHDPVAGAKLLASGGDLDDPDVLTAFLVQNARQLGMAGRILFPIPDRGLSQRLGRVRAKTLIVWGASDRLVPPPYGRAFVEAMTDAELISIPEAGHMAPLERPQEVAEAIAIVTSK